MDYKKNEETKVEETKEIKVEKISEKKKQEQRIVFIIISLLVLSLLALLVFKFPPKDKKSLNIDEAKIKAETFINENLMMPGTKANIKETVEEYGLYKLTVDVGMEDTIESYLDKNGKLFFPQAFEIDTYINPYLEEMEMNMDAIEATSTEDEVIIE